MKILLLLILMCMSQIIRADSKGEDDDKDQGKQFSISFISQSLESMSRAVISSMAGGTKIYIKANGHSLNPKKIQVYVGNFPCAIPSGGVNENYITCETADPQSSKDIFGLPVTAISNKKTFVTKSPDVVNYQWSGTPVLNQIFPSVGFSQSIIYLYGNNQISNSGDGKDLGDIKEVWIGNHQCKAIDIPQANYYSYIKCSEQSEEEAGKYNVSQKFRQGFAKKNEKMLARTLNKGQSFDFTLLPIVSSVSTNKGDEGGQRLKIKGSGFSKNKKNNTVSVDGHPCIVSQADSNQLTCILQPRNAGISTRIASNSTNQTKGYISGAGVSYIRYFGVNSLSKFTQDFRAGVSPGTIVEKGFRGELKEYTYNNNANIGQVWNGYFTPPVTGKYTFRGFANSAFSFYLSTVYGSAQPPSTPLIYSNSPTQRWSSFYYDDITTAQASLSLAAGASYYMQAYHISSSSSSFFKISVDVPNNNTDLPYQTFQVHKLFLNTTLQPEIVTYSMSGGTNSSSIILKIVRTDQSGRVSYSQNATVPYGCTQGQFYNALMNFDSFRSYRISVVRKMYDSNETLTNSSIDASRYDYQVSFFLLRQSSVQIEDFIVTKVNFTGEFNKEITTQHSPLISGSFSFTIGGVQFNNISYNIAPESLQSIIRNKIKGYQKIEVESRSQYGCEYWCTWIISYREVNSAIPSFIVNTAQLKGGITQPDITHAIRRHYSPSIIFEPIDYRFLGTASHHPSVLVETNGHRAVCTGNCSYEFIDVAKIASISYNNNRLTISVSYTINTIRLEDIFITINGKYCKIQAGSTSTSISCIMQLVNGEVPLAAGLAILQVQVKPFGIFKIAQEISPLTIPLIVFNASLTSGGANGGSINTLFGSGFTPNKQQIQITICNKSATIISSTYGKIVFYMPSCSASGTHQFTIIIGGINDTSIDYTYNPTQTPIINSVQPNSSNPTKKTKISIYGSGYGLDPTVVSIHLSNQTGRIYQLKILSINDSCIEAGLPGGLPGIYKVEVALTNGQGLAVPSSPSVDIFSYEFAISSVTPNTGSFFGGTLLNITGINLLPGYTDTLVYIGYALNWFCKIQSISESYVTCRTPPSHPRYQSNESLQVSISSKVYMMNKCPQNNCFFTYMDQALSPNLTSISATVASSSPITLTGTNFTVSPSNSCQIVLSGEDGSADFVLPAISCNSSSAQFVVQSNIPFGSYYVKVRNIIGESNPLQLKVNWIFGTASLNMGSTEGALVTFSGGSGYPLGLGSVGYISLYAPSLNRYYDVNITNYSSNGLTIQLPSTPSSTIIKINFITPTQTTFRTFTSSNSKTPNISLTSQQALLPGVRSITFKRDDNLISLPILNITLVSTIDSSNNITVSAWNTINQTYTFSARLFAGSYKILALTSYGFCKISSTINVLTNSGANIATKQVSFAGDSVYIMGNDLSPSSYIKVNGFIGNLLSYNTSGFVYKVPAQTSASIQNQYQLKKVSAISPSLLTTFSDNDDSFNASAVIDGDKRTIYGSVSNSCWVGIDVGQSLTAFIDRITYFPQSDWTNVGKKLIDAVFQGSKNKLAWDVLGKLDQSVHIGWNTIKFNTSEQYRYIRFRHNSTSQCNLAEIKLYGILYTDQPLSVTSQTNKVTYYDGYNKIDFQNILEFRQDHTPVVQSISPLYGDVFGGYDITITGKYLNFATPTVQIDSIQCTVSLSNQTHIICAVGARPKIPQQNTFVVLVGSAEAVLNSVFLYVLRWSDFRTWGVDLPPIDGDLVYVPAGMTLLIDQSTPHLLGITAQDGTIIFSNDTDITVYTGFITMNGGTLIAGTQSKPLGSNLKIVLEGNLFGAQQPIFGNKGIGCLDCKLSIYGRPRKAWTTIDQTISPGDTSLIVSTAVDWKVGERIVVASTSFDHNQSESRYITQVNGNVFTVDSPFAYQHLSIQQSYGASDKLQIKAEVGLLSRNIKITGDDESNITQYGAHLLATKSLSNNLEVQIGYTEFTQCGQSYIPGRYCIFFSKARQVSTSFIRGNSVYNSYARLVGLYQTEYLTIQSNVGYRIKGHNIFLQSGTEVHNTIRNNLLISSLKASNMLQSDYSVASIWITHPTNHVYDNHAAGSDYYGIAYQIGDNTEQSSDICPVGNRLGLMANNVIHSNNRFGMRIYKLYSRVCPCQLIRDDFKTDPWAANPSIASVFHNFTIYKNILYGALAQQVGHLVFNNFTVAENIIAGIQIFKGNFTREMVSVTNSTIIGQSIHNYDPNSTKYRGMYGVVTPRTGQSNLTNVRFYNYYIATSALVTCSQCNAGYLTNLGSQIFIKNVKFQSIEGKYLEMLGQRKDIIYDLDASLSSYFFTSAQNSGTIVNGFNHIAQNHKTQCKAARINQSSWGNLIMCSSQLTIRRITFTNVIGSAYYYQFYWINMYVYPISNVTQVINLTTIDTSLVTPVQYTSASIQLPNSWSLPFVTGTIYQVWWGGSTSITDYNHLSITTTRLFNSNDLGVVFKIPYTLNRELYSVGPMRNFQFPTNDQLISQSVDPPSPSTCVNGEYSHNNDAGSRMLSICQSGKNKTQFQYTEVNAIFCKYVCPQPPVPSSSSLTIIKQNFVRLWSNASQWPNKTVPQYMQDVYVNGNWTILLDMDPYPASYMIIDGTVVADDTRDVFITANSIHVRAGNISVGNSQNPFTHKFIIQINNTRDHKGWVIDQLYAGNKYITVTGSLNLYGSPPSTVTTDLTQTAFANSSLIYVASSSGWKPGDSIALSPSFSNSKEYQRVTIQSINSNGTISITPPLKYTHYGSSQQVNSRHGSINVNTKVGHLTRNIKIVSGPDYSYGLDIAIYGYFEGDFHRKGTAVLNGVQIQRSTLRFFNTKEAVSTITSCSIHDALTTFLSIENSNQISLLNNFFFNSAYSGVAISKVDKLTFNQNVITGVSTGCFSLFEYLSPGTSSIKNNFCLGSSGYGFAFPHIKCSELESNPMANNTAGSCSVGFIFNNIETSDGCKAFSYIKAYACKIGQICNPMKTYKLVFEHFILADNERGVTLKFGSNQGKIQHIALLSYSYITAISRPSCSYCYGANATKCSNNIGMRLLSVSGDGQSLYTSYDLLNYDNITSAEVINSKAYLKNVIFDNFKATYSSSCSNNYVFRPHTNAHDAVATHVLYDSSCSNCDSISYLLADPNNPNHIGWEGGCGQILCTGKSNYLIIDYNGTFIGNTATIIPNQLIGYNQPMCSYVEHMNAFICARTDFAILAYQSTAKDYNTRIMWPVNLTYDGANYTTQTNGWREWEWVGRIPRNHRLGRFLSIIKLNSVYNMSFVSMAPLSMQIQIQRRWQASNSSNHIVIKLKYPLPNMIRIQANGKIIDPIPLTDSGLRRQLNKTICGDNVYFFKNYTTNFVITEGDCLVQLQLMDMIQLTTKFAMTTQQFFSNTVLSSYINNLCALLGIQDTSRVKIVGVLSGSIEINTIILPPSTNSTNSTTADNNTTNTTSSNETSASTEPTLTQVQSTLDQSVTSQQFSDNMTNATGYPFLGLDYQLHLIDQPSEDNSASSSSIILIALTVGLAILIIAVILTIVYCRRRKARAEFKQAANISVFPQKVKVVKDRYDQVRVNTSNETYLNTSNDIQINTSHDNRMSLPYQNQMSYQNQANASNETDSNNFYQIDDIIPSNPVEIKRMFQSIRPQIVFQEDFVQPDAMQGE